MRIPSIILMSLCLLVGGCASHTYKVRAFDLKGEKIYEGELVREYTGELKTKEGLRVGIQNATVIMEEVKK